MVHKSTIADRVDGYYPNSFLLQQLPKIGCKQNFVDTNWPPAQHKFSSDTFQTTHEVSKAQNKKKDYSFGASDSVGSNVFA